MPAVLHAMTSCRAFSSPVDGLRNFPEHVHQGFVHMCKSSLNIYAQIFATPSPVSVQGLGTRFCHIRSHDTPNMLQASRPAATSRLAAPSPCRTLPPQTARATPIPPAWPSRLRRRRPTLRCANGQTRVPVPARVPVTELVRLQMSCCSVW